MSAETIITIDLNKDALIHVLRYIRGVYVTPHREKDDSYGTEQCPYCLTVLVALQKGLEDIELRQQIQRLRQKAKERIDKDKKRQGV